MNLKKIEISLISIFCTLFLIFLTFSVIFPTGYMQGGDYEYLVSIVLSFALLLWGITMIYRVQYEKQKHYIIVLVITFFFWIVLRFIKWLPNIHFISIYADYFYYVPMTLIPIIFLVMTMETFFSNIKIKKYIYVSVMSLAAILIILVLTNDLHFLVYKNFTVTYGDNPNIEIIKSEYNFLHYVALGYVGLISFGTFVIFLIGSRNQVSFKQFIFILSSFILLITYIALYTAGVFSKIAILRDFATCVTLLLTLLLEVLFDIGLIQNNGRYKYNFLHSSIEMSILDENNKKIYETLHKNKISEKDKKVTTFNIGSYTAIVKEDLTNINKIQESIKQEANNISKTNKDLEKLIEINKEEAIINYRLSLVEEIAKNISKTKNEVLSLNKSLPDQIDPESKKSLGFIQMLLGYMKQKCMLILKAKEQTKLDSDSVHLLMNMISKDILSAGYEDMAINITSFKDIDISFVSLVNDFLHEIIKAYAFSGATLLVNLNPNNETCKIQLFKQNIKEKNLTIKDIKFSEKTGKNEIAYLLEAQHE